MLLIFVRSTVGCCLDNTFQEFTSKDFLNNLTVPVCGPLNVSPPATITGAM